FIALPGTTLAIDEPSYFEKIMDTAEGVVRSYLNGENVEDEIQEMYAPDAMLWMAWTLQQYAQYTSTKQMIQKYGDIQEEVTRYILDGKHWNLHLEENGLLTVNGHDQAATWMNAVVDGRPVTQRSGYVVEINALWYNTLLFTAEILAKKDPVKAQELQVLAEKTQKSFVETFWNGRYLYDFVEGDFSDIAIRPNQIFAVSLPYSPLDKAQQKSVLDKVTKELYTPKGLRSLTPQNSGYHGRYDSNERERNYAYHNGPVWPWLFGPYLEAYLKIYKNSGLSFVERSMIGMEEEVSHHCVGTISELFDGNPPFQGRGAVSFAMSVAEILRVMQIVKKYNL
ncbi:MAG: 4-alpha-glucanotransferase, partial [Paludibacteraceae bacterium]|nr:4-alpha-glucanotransferase [Paludibacteraceae bacterium]